jgi:hypothetical protein
MRKRAFLPVLALFSSMPFAAVEAMAGNTPPRFCSGQNCLSNQARSVEPCKGLDCAPPGAGKIKECGGQDCQLIPDQVTPIPEEQKVEPPPEDGKAAVPENDKAAPAPVDKKVPPQKP